jgi:hypothetical protein
MSKVVWSIGMLSRNSSKTNRVIFMIDIKITYKNRNKSKNKCKNVIITKLMISTLQKTYNKRTQTIKVVIIT